MKTTTFITVFLSMMHWKLTSAQSSMTDLADGLLNPVRYDKRVRPGTDSGNPVVVKLGVYIISISSIDEVNMQYTVSVYFRQQWRDERLTFTDPKEAVTLNYDMYDKLWVPDVFISNEKTGHFHSITLPNRLLRLDPNGNIYFSQRFTMTLGCSLNLKYYPMDNQTCKMTLESYGYKADEIVLEWNADSPVEVDKNLEMPEFVLTGTDAKDCTATYQAGTFSCLYVELKLQRQFEYYLIQTFVPSSLIVALSWVSYWIDIHAVPARISLSLLTVLTMTTQSSGISARLPRVSYIKAIDIWMTTCLVFVFGGLIEYSIVNVLARKEKECDKKDEEEEQKSMHEIERARMAQILGNGKKRGISMNRKHRVVGTTTTIGSSKKISMPGIFLRMKKNPALGVDMVSRVLFPAVFLVFNIIYWSVFEVHGLGNDGNSQKSQE